MYNRYQGNTGRVVKVEETPERRPGRVQSRPAPAPRPAPEPVRRGAQNTPAIFGKGIMEQLGKLLPNGIGELETEDIILLLILYLMYRESGDSELLIIMGAMFLL